MKTLLPQPLHLAAALCAVALALGAGVQLMPTSRAADQKPDGAKGAHANNEAGAVARRVLAVEATQPKRQEWARNILASGGVYAWQEASVSSELGGVALQEILVDVGSVVKRGQILARLSQDAQQATLATQQANVARARATLAEASANAIRARQLKESGALSAQQIQQLQLSEDVARAGLEAALAGQRTEEIRLRQTVIRAADDGVISARNATLGAVVQPGTELFRLVRQGRVEWRAELTAEQLMAVRIGQKVRVRLSDGRSVEGAVRMISPTLDASSRKALAYVDLPAAKGKPAVARAGMFGQGEIVMGQTPALTLSNAALVLRDGNAYAFEIMANDMVEQRKLTLGRHLGSEVEILEGLSEKSRVVARGGAFLNHHDRVQVIQATQAAQTPQAMQVDTQPTTPPQAIVSSPASVAATGTSAPRTAAP